MPVFQPHIFLSLCVLFSLLMSFICKHHFQVQANLAKSDEYQVESWQDSQASSCLCADEAKTYHWNITAVRLGKRRKGLDGHREHRAKAQRLRSPPLLHLLCFFFPFRFTCFYFSLPKFILQINKQILFDR